MIVTFYSFKGGTGRTMAMANIASLLSRRGKRVLVVDFDLEAPGLWQYFSRFYEGLERRPGLIDLLLQAAMVEDALTVAWRDYVTEVSLGSSIISFMTSGTSGEGYPSRVLDFDWTAFFQHHNGGEFIEQLRNQWLLEYDFTFIDSRTGITDSGGICTIMLPDLLVPVFMSNYQSIDGVVDVVARAQARRNELAYDRPPALILPIMSRFDSRTEYQSAQEWLDIAADKLKPFYADWLPPEFTPRQALEKTKLPYVAYFSFGETMPALAQGTSDPESLGYALNTVSQLIEEYLGNADQILDADTRDNKVSARHLRIPEETVWDFFLSYVQADQVWAEWIAWVLKEEGYRIQPQVWDFVPGYDGGRAMWTGVRDAERTIAVWSPDYLELAHDNAGWQAAWADRPRGGVQKMLVVRVGASQLPGVLGDAVNVDLFGVNEAEARRRLLDMASTALTGRRVAAVLAVPPDRIAEVRFPGSLPHTWQVPLRNAGFVGRGPALGELARRMAAEPGAATVRCVQGLAGVGKTQLALEYAHAHARDYDLVWWITAGDRSTMAGQFAALASRLDLHPAAYPEDLQAQIRDRLRGPASWLLIFDDADAVGDIQPWLPARLPAGIRGHAIVTTRRGGFGVLGPVLDLDVVTTDEMVRLLQDRVAGLNRNTATQIGDELGRLPLALEQAAAYMNSRHVPPREYLELLRNRAADLLGLAKAGSGEGTIATLWDGSIRRVGSTSPAATQLLAMCAYLGSEPIPLALFSAHPDLLPEPLSRAAADELAFADTVAVLTDFSLVQRTDVGGLQVHRLLQLIMRARLDRQVSASATSRRAQSPDSEKVAGLTAWPPGRALQLILDLLHADAPRQVTGAPEDWPRWVALLPHVMAATGYLDQAARPPDPETMSRASWLLNQAGAYLQMQARLTDAATLVNRALRIDEAILGPDDPAVATDLGHLALILRDLKRPQDAEPLARRALAIDEAAYGQEHPAIATDLGHLALILRDLKRPQDAEPLARRALAIDEAAYGQEHPAIATDLGHLALILRDLKRPQDAEPLARRALAIDEAAYGQEHPAIATDLGHLALILRDLRRPREGRPLLLRALAVLAPNRPVAARDLNALAAVLQDLGEPEMARPLRERALVLAEGRAKAA